MMTSIFFNRTIDEEIHSFRLILSDPAKRGGTMFDALETAPLIETGQAPLLLPPADSAEGPTLQDALGAKQDAIPADLWHAGTVPSDNPGPGDPGSSQLRPLRPDELLLIAGGNGSEISVWGPDPEPEPDWEWWNDDSPSNDYDPGYWGNGGGDG